MTRKRHTLSTPLLNLPLLLLLPGLFLAACSQLQAVPVNSDEAQRMVFDSVTANKSPDTVASFTVLGSQPGFQGHVIAYWMCRPAAPNAPAVAISGYAVVRKYRGGNQGIQVNMQGEGSLPAVGSLIEFIASSNDQMQENQLVIFGRILSPEVQAVEVIYADEQRLRWPAGGEGFLLFHQEPVEWTKLNILGENEQVLKTYDLTNKMATHSERDESGKIDCPRDQTTLPAVEPLTMPTETPSTALVVQGTMTPFENVAEPITMVPEATETIPPSPVVGGRIIASEGDAMANVRSGPGAIHDRIGTLPDGKTIQITARSPQGDWWRIHADGLDGWVYAAFVIVEGDPLALPCVSFSNGDCAPAALPSGNDQAVTAIREFLGNPELPLVFQREEIDPNADMRDVWVYTDSNGGEFWVDQETMRVVQWMPRPSADSGKAITVEDLYSHALTFAYRQSPRLAQNPGSLTFTQMTKDGSHYAFRWEDQNITGHMMVPFLQVVIRTDGEIVQYMNSLDVIGR